MSTIEEYQAEFVGFRSQLTSFIYRFVAAEADAEDIVQDAYERAFKNLAGFRGEASFKTWVFRIATNLAKDALKRKKRWDVDYQDNCRTATYASQTIQAEMADIAQNSPQGRFELNEHINYCFTCMTKTLRIESQLCVILKEVYHFKVVDIMHITGLTEGQVKHNLTDGRRNLTRIFDGRCSLIEKNGVCHQCSELSGMFNPRAQAAEELQKIRMIRDRESGDKDHLLDLRFELVSQIDPVNSAGFDFHHYMLRNLPSHSQEDENPTDSES